MKNLHNRVSRDELKKQLHQDPTPRITLSFYTYYQIQNVPFFRDHLYVLLSSCAVLGRIYVSSEGVNGQLSVPQDRFEEFKTALYSITFLDQCRLNIAIDDDGKSFFVLTIKMRKKIVADGLNDDSFDVTDRGQHLNAQEFNSLTENADTIIVDMRNHYESEVGHFKDALCPDVETFREALPKVEEMLDSDKDKDIVMYCTGGIRCEKASAYLKHKGFKKVYQLDGGIIEYARQVNQHQLKNKFIGKNFVFDERLGERISQDIISKCHQCGKSCDAHTNCSNEACHILFIQCADCAEKYTSCCSKKCSEFQQLPADKKEELKGKIEFNGTKFGKGRYKALHKDEKLNVS